MKQRIVLLLLILAGIVVACAPSPEELAQMASVAATATAQWWTPTPTNTATPTDTPTATPTLTPTPTPVPTDTPIPTPTEDPEAGLWYTVDDETFRFLKLEGWEALKMGLEYPALIGPTEGDVNMNLIMAQEEAALGLEMYAEAIVDNLDVLLREYDVTSEEYLTNSNEIPYFRMVFQTVQYDIELQQTYYVFDGGDWKLVITYTRASAAGEAWDAAVDASMESLEYNR